MVMPCVSYPSQRTRNSRAIPLLAAFKFERLEAALNDMAALLPL